MDIDIRDTITLSDGKKYVVASKTNYKEKNYYYLVDINNNSNIKFCEEDNNEFVEIDNQEIIKNLIPLFTNEVKDILKEIIEQN